MGFHLLIAGGGVAALEAALAIRETAPGGVQTTVLAPDEEFAYRPLAAVEPFGLGEMRRIPMAELAGEIGFARHVDRLERVDPERRVATTATGTEIRYDALLLALGARPNEALAGAITYGGPAGNDALADLLHEIRRGEVRRVGLVVPPGSNWPLPIYELALMTAAKAQHWRIPLRVDVVTTEGSPLAIFGRRASARVADLLATAEIRTITSAAAVGVDAAGIHLATGRIVGADRVVCLPRLDVPPIPGIPQGPRGFIGTDRFMKVEDVPRVWAAGDATWFPIKQGGIATQQADTAAHAIAHIVDPSIEVEPFRPVLRGALLTGRAPHYLRAVVGGRDESSDASGAPLWWPPAKVAGRHLGPFLARSRNGNEPVPDLGDIEAPHGEDLERTEAEHRDAVELALTAAEADARWRDFGAALRWLEVAEHLDLTLPPEFAAKREIWSIELEDQRRLERAAAG